MSLDEFYADCVAAGCSVMPGIQIVRSSDVLVLPGPAVPPGVTVVVDKKLFMPNLRQIADNVRLTADVIYAPELQFIGRNVSLTAESIFAGRLTSLPACTAVRADYVLGNLSPDFPYEMGPHGWIKLQERLMDEEGCEVWSAAGAGGYRRYFSARLVVHEQTVRFAAVATEGAVEELVARCFTKLAEKNPAAIYRVIRQTGLVSRRQFCALSGAHFSVVAPWWRGDVTDRESVGVGVLLSEITQDDDAHLATTDPQFWLRSFRKRLQRFDCVPVA